MDLLRTRSEVHEAGHAVVGWVQGQRIQLIVVRPRGLGGFVRFDPFTGVSPLEADLVDLVTSKAGWLAQDMVSPETVRPTDEADLVAATERWAQALPDQKLRERVQHALSDERDAGALIDDEAAIAAVAARYAPDERVWLVAFAGARATRLITEHRGAILALAAALARRPILDGAAVEAILEAHERS